MSKSAFVEFYGNYLESAAGEAARRQLEGIRDKQSFCVKMVAAGAASGFEFTAEEVLAVMEASEAQAAKALAAASGELSDSALEGVVGGAGGPGDVTVTIGHSLVDSPNPNLTAPMQGSKYVGG